MSQTTPVTTPADREAHLTEALNLIIDQSRGGCANTTTPGLGHCFDDGKTADAKYGIDMACPPCIAHAALNGLPIPLGPGRDAEAEILTSRKG